MPGGKPKITIPVGTVIGEIEVTGDGFSKGGHWYYPCRCSCGKERSWVGSRLAMPDGHRYALRNCGHINQAKHGDSYTTLYKVWSQMKQRCLKETSQNYRNYGGRGISLSPEFLKWEAFRDWAFSAGYAEGLELDRINNNGNYSPENCRWTDRKTQCNNTRWNRMVTAWGETKTLAQWAQDSRCNALYHTVLCRLNNGWEAEMAIGLPSKRS